MLDLGSYPRWPMTAAEAWIATKSEKAVLASWNVLVVDEADIRENREREARANIEGQWQEWVDFQGRTTSLGCKAAEEFTTYWINRPIEHYFDLWDCLKRGTVTAWGIPTASYDYVKIDPVQFDIQLPQGHNTVGTFFGGCRYRLIQVDASELRAVFPPITQVHKRTRGRSAQYDWPAFMAECERVWNYHGGFSDDDPNFRRPSHLIKIMAQWCANDPAIWKDGPGDTMLKQKVNEFLVKKGR